MTGLFRMGSMALGMTLVIGKKRVPRPAAKITAFLTGFVILLFAFGVLYVNDAGLKIFRLGDGDDQHVFVNARVDVFSVDVVREYNGAGKSSPEQFRSEERRVGKEGRSRWSPYH